MGATTTTNGNEFGIIATFQNVHYHSSSFAKFRYFNRINCKPQAEMLLIDKNTEGAIDVKSADYLRLTFLNTSENAEAGGSSLIGLITDLSWEDSAGQNSMIKIKWEAGTEAELAVKNFIQKGTSASALSEVFKDRGSRHVNEAVGDYEPTDNMTWRMISTNLWGAADDIVSNSYIKGDYLFWVWDEVNDNYHISTLKNERNKKLKHVFMRSGNSIASTDNAKHIFFNPDMIMWQYDKCRYQSTYGKNVDKLFPNVVVTNVNGTDIATGNAKKACFSELLKEMGDTKQEQLAETTDMKSAKTVFTPVKVKRHYANNTHSMYPIANEYRDYTYATYGKAVYVVIYNNIGPAVGTLVHAVVISSDSNVRGVTIDETYTDRYLVVEKLVEYDVSQYSALGHSRPASDNWKTTLTLVSDNPQQGDPADLDQLKQLLDTKDNAK